MDQADAIHRAIWRLKAEFFLAIDQKRWDDFARFFTRDARIDYSRARPESDEPVPAIPSLQAYVDFARQFVGSARTVHQGSTPIIDIVKDDQVHALWRMEDIILRSPDDMLPFGHGFGIYEDEYRLTEDGWRIDSLAFTRLLFLPIASG